MRSTAPSARLPSASPPDWRSAARLQDQLQLFVHFDESQVRMACSARAPLQTVLGREGYRPNLDPKLYAAICKAAAIDPADTAMAREESVDAHPSPGASRHPLPQAGEGLEGFRAATGEARPSEVKLFDYIYGVLHSPAYRETFAEFLKIDFPRIPYPPSPQVFRHVSERGEELRRLHLMEPAAIGEAPYPYMGEGDDVVVAGFPKFEKSSPERGGGPSAEEQTVEGPHASAPRTFGDDAPGSTVGPLHHSAAPSGSPPRSGEELGRVHINKDQYFDGVPAIAWNFHIGGYQPAQKWLKDRRGRTLSFDDITHYQRIVKILAETDRIMKQIELPLG
ncbi:MAG TPA: type ISP restriction/modification enzyme [Sphingomicrobium sp.]|nr:type ISP restriction/modification enzyme [Sphingomicrobium sp.]